MAIRARNLDPAVGNEPFQQVIIMPVNVGASLDQRVVEVRLPWAGKILSAHFRASTLTDADDSVRITLQVDGADVTAATDPGASDTTTALTLTATAFAAGSLLQLHVLTGLGDALVGTLTVVVRPYLGVIERTAHGLVG